MTRLDRDRIETVQAYWKKLAAWVVVLRPSQLEAYLRAPHTTSNHSNSRDTPARNDPGHKDRLCPVLDKTLSAPLYDWDQRGLLEPTVALAMGEFGRTPFVNPDPGRDHWPTCQSFALGGGGIKGAGCRIER